MSWKVYCNTHRRSLGRYNTKPEAHAARRTYETANPQCDVSVTGTQGWQLHSLIASTTGDASTWQVDLGENSTLIGLYPSKSAALKSLKETEQQFPNDRIALIKF